MASIAHQFIMQLVSRKMRLMGYEPIAYDGDSYQIGRYKLKIPMKIIEHRPDLIGINMQKEFAIGEAKTKNDLSSKRTRRQLTDFSKFGPLIIGAPKSAEYHLYSQLKRFGLLFQKNVSMVVVPDELIPNDEENI